MEKLLDIEGLSVESNPVALVLPTLACLFSSLTGGRKSYRGYELLRINLNSTRAYNTLNGIYLSNTFDFMTPPQKGSPTDVLVCPEQLLPMKGLFRTLAIPYDVAVQDFERYIERERAENEAKRSSEMNWDAYQKLSVIQDWMDLKAQEYPDFLQTENYGKSTEGRDLKVLKISTGGNGVKPAVWIDGGIHAREWISPATVSYMANELIEIAAQGKENPDYKYVSEVDWYINPNLNPDGYEYTQIDRMWRKTRSKANSFFPGFGCVGVDPNRNWGYHWGGKGTSNNPCSQIYRGPMAASEPEVNSTQNYIYEKRDQIKLFLTFHSYSQMIFTPWGYDEEAEIDDKEDLMLVANNAKEALKSVHGTEYQAGSSPELLYAAAGGSEDFAKGIAEIKFAFCYELRDTGKNGFMLPPDQIKPSGEETFVAVKSMVKDVMSYYKVAAFEDEKPTRAV